MSEDAADMPQAGPLARWSRRKRLAATAAAGPGGATHGEAAAQAGEVEPAIVEPAGREAERPLPSHLPDVDQLGPDSDFTPFLAKDVPEVLHRQALRALWRSDPLFAYRDGLTDYDEDYTKIGIVACAVQTAYRAGSGYAADPPATPPDTEAPVEIARLDEAADPERCASEDATATDVAANEPVENPSGSLGQDS